jgi:glycosyltransferase involved in cell wall biosynthesis
MTRSVVRVLELRSVRGTGGGPEKTILLGTAQTDPQRFGITVCYLRDERDDVFGIDQWAERLGVDYCEIRERNSFDPSIWGPLRRLVRDRGIQIVHSHDYKTNLLAWLLAKAENIIPLSTVHGWTGHSRRERFLYYPADKRVLRRFPRLIAVSSEIRRELIRCGAVADRVEVILNGIDHRRFQRRPELRAPARAALNLEPDDVVIGAVGRLEPQKRFDLLMTAVARLRAERPNLRLLIAGDGSLAAPLQQTIAALDLQPICRLVGHREDVPTFHHALDLLVQSSDYEGTPNAVLEAMALQTPIVATDVGGTAELITNGVHGLVVPPGDVDAIAAAIEAALGDASATRSRADAARLRVERELSFERRMQSVETVYQALIDEQAKALGASPSHECT